MVNKFVFSVIVMMRLKLFVLFGCVICFGVYFSSCFSLLGNMFCCCIGVLFVLFYIFIVFEFFKVFSVVCMFVVVCFSVLVCLFGGSV